MCAVNARTGSISTTVTRPPSPSAARATPLPTQPYPTTQNSRPAASTFVNARIAVSVVWPVPYGLSNMCLQRASFAAIAGKLSLPSAASARSRATPVVVSSLTPRSRAYRSGSCSAILRVSSRPSSITSSGPVAATASRSAVNSSGGDAVPRMHLDAALDERRTDRILGRERVAAGRDHLGTRLAQREHEARGLRFQVHDDRELAAAQRTVGQTVCEQPVQDGHVLPRPLDAPVPLRCERRISNAGQRVARAGLEPATPRFSAVCSTN